MSEFTTLPQLHKVTTMLCHVHTMLTRLRLSLVAVVNNFGIVQAVLPKPELKAHLNDYPP